MFPSIKYRSLASAQKFSSPHTAENFPSHLNNSRLRVRYTSTLGPLYKRAIASVQTFFLIFFLILTFMMAACAKKNMKNEVTIETRRRDDFFYRNVN